MKGLLVSILALFTLTLQAQEPESRSKRKIKLSGTILDQDTGSPLEYATVVLQSVEDPSAVTGGITDLDGNFSVEAPAGTYNIRVEYLSYETYSIEKQRLTRSVNLG